MRIRSVAVAGLAGVVLLSGCGTATPDPSGAPTDAETPAELVLPDDAVLGLVGILTAANGATSDFAMVVHASLPHLVPDATAAVEATARWCADEVDATVIAGRGFTFTTVDVRVTPRDGEWPGDVSLLVLPVVNPEVGSTLVAGEGLRQVDEATDAVFGDTVPNCRQPALLEGAGEGSLSLGIPQDITGANDNEPFTAWTLHRFGLSAVLPGDLGESDVVFSACAAALTPLGEEFGAAGATWTEEFDATACSVGAPAPR